MPVLMSRRSFISLLQRNSEFLFKSRSHVSFSLDFSTSAKKQQPFPTTPTVSQLFLQKHDFSPQAAAQITSALTRVKNPENPNSVLSFLKENGFSKTQLEKIMIYRPQILVASLENNIKPKFKFFQDLGFSASEISVIISKDPWFLKNSLNNRLAPSLAVLKGILGSKEEVANLLKHSSWFLTRDLEKTLVPNIEFLMSCGVQLNQILKIIHSFPRFFLIKPEIMRKCADKADRIGVDRSSGMYLHAVRVIASMSEETWELKLQSFRNMGFSEKDILSIYKKSPQVFVVSIEKMKKIKELLLATGKYDISCIVNRPQALSTSVEKRYRPRLQVLNVLESKNLIKKWPNLGVVYLMPDEKFHEKFVAPYINEIGQVNMATSAVSGK
ncbi:hypothetical protein ACJIZ3_003215 [Penstemon smallii]|uniref:Uncharacterized protein n=1 Tax=Penstemon smallii TaxID=265156 RepID=A0ABD3UC08_9LAMI